MPTKRPTTTADAGTPGSKPARAARQRKPAAATGRAPRRTAAKAVPLRPRVVEDDVLVDHAEHAARDAHLLDLLDRISA